MGDESRTYVITGSASGMGAATAARLEAVGHRVIGIDLVDAEVTVDLGTVEGRATAYAAVEERTDVVDGAVTFAGISGLTDRPGAPLVSVNYFGTVVLLEGLCHLLARAPQPAGLVTFLLGPDARFFCGSVIFADGGTDALLRPDDWPAAMGTS